jgi:hypothetical protein
MGRARPVPRAPCGRPPQGRRRPPHHWQWVTPAGPSSMRHAHSGSSRDQTCLGGAGRRRGGVGASRAHGGARHARARHAAACDAHGSAGRIRLHAAAYGCTAFHASMPPAHLDCRPVVQPHQDIPRVWRPREAVDLVEARVYLNHLEGLHLAAGGAGPGVLCVQRSAVRIARRRSARRRIDRDLLRAPGFCITWFRFCRSRSQRPAFPPDAEPPLDRGRYVHAVGRKDGRQGAAVGLREIHIIEGGGQPASSSCPATGARSRGTTTVFLK